MRWVEDVILAGGRRRSAVPAVVAKQRQTSEKKNKLYSLFGARGVDLTYRQVVYIECGATKSGDRLAVVGLRVAVVSGCSCREPEWSQKASRAMSASTSLKKSGPDSEPFIRRYRRTTAL